MLALAKGQGMNKPASFEIQFPLQSRSGLSGSPDAVPHTDRGRLPRITQVLALALQFEDMLHRGESKDYADLARLCGLCRERVSQIMRLTYLAPDIQVELIYLPSTPTGQYPISETTVRKVASLLSWAEQRQEWQRLKHGHHVD
jgi:hypothetical protein